MYISDIALLFIIIIISYCWYSNSKKIKNNYNNDIDNINAKHKLNIEELNKEIKNLSKNHTIEIISLILNCSEEKANDTLKILKNTDLEIDFKSAGTLIKKKNIIKLALKKESSAEAYKIFCKKNLIPLIKENNYNITLEQLYECKDEYIQHSELSDDEKLKQLDFYFTNNNKNRNHMLLLKLVNISPTELNNDDFFSKEEIINMANLFISKFNITIKNYNEADFYEFFSENNNYKGMFTIEHIITRIIYINEDLNNYWDYHEKFKSTYFDIFNKKLPSKL